MKKLLSLTLALVMALGLALPASAAERLRTNRWPASPKA